jgi:GTPase SAR1 family protein
METTLDTQIARKLRPGSPLVRIAELALEAGAAEIAREALALADRVAEGRFYVACVGQFKRGKSTLLNAVCGQSVLPVGVAPVTAVVTVLRHGEQLGARVQFSGGSWRDIAPAELADYVTEDRNPENARGVAGVEVFVPSPLLESGMCLVDTPGIGSVFAGNTAATREFVPHIDAALVVLGGDPPISGEELALVHDVASRIEDLVFVMSKADRLSDPEREEALSFTRRVLAEKIGRKARGIFVVSATERLARAGTGRDFDRLLDTLGRLSRESGSDLVRGAEQRGARTLGQQLLHAIEEARGALTRPLVESERRIESLKECAAQAERSMSDLGYLWNAEQDRLRRAFDERRDRFLETARKAAMAELEHALAAVPGRGPALRRKATLLAQEIFRRWVDQWKVQEQPVAEEQYRRAAQRFVDIANGFLERLAKSGEPALAGLQPIGPEAGFRTRSRLYYTELWSLTGAGPFGWVADLVRPRQSALRAITASAGEYLERLLTANTSRVVSDLDDRVLESRRRLEGEIRARLREIYGSAERALEAARERRAAGVEAVARELDRIEHLRTSVEALLGTDS